MQGRRHLRQRSLTFMQNVYHHTACGVPRFAADLASRGTPPLENGGCIPENSAFGNLMMAGDGIRSMTAIPEHLAVLSDQTMDFSTPPTSKEPVECSANAGKAEGQVPTAQSRSEQWVLAASETGVGVPSVLTNAPSPREDSDDVEVADTGYEQAVILADSPIAPDDEKKPADGEPVVDTAILALRQDPTADALPSAASGLSEATELQSFEPAHFVEERQVQAKPELARNEMAPGASATSQELETAKEPDPRKEPKPHLEGTGISDVRTVTGMPDAESAKAASASIFTGDRAVFGAELSPEQQGGIGESGTQIPIARFSSEAEHAKPPRMISSRFGAISGVDGATEAERGTQAKTSFPEGAKREQLPVSELRSTESVAVGNVKHPASMENVSGNGDGAINRLMSADSSMPRERRESYSENALFSLKGRDGRGAAIPPPERAGMPVAPIESETIFTQPVAEYSRSDEVEAEFAKDGSSFLASASNQTDGSASLAKQALSSQIAAKAVREAAVQVAEITRNAAEGKVEVRLNPEELGRLSISFLTRDSAMAISILAERPETMDLVRRNIGELLQELRDIGFQELSVDVGSSHENGAASKDTSAEKLLSDDTDAPEIKTRPVAITERLFRSSGIDVRI